MKEVTTDVRAGAGGSRGVAAGGHPRVLIAVQAGDALKIYLSPKVAGLHYLP